MQYVVGIIAIGIGFLITWKSDWLMNNFGRIAWAEAHLGTEGGTRMLYKLIGIVTIIFAFLYMSGAMGSILRGIFSSSIDSVGT
ncbi:hypothetical protein IID19_03345 [Patescibacteria group bacterium]|nr:hypothetical protein [Patescibacteria group bacterium]